MAARQQQQIEQQQQLLVAKEQRLKYLKQHEFQQHHMAAEYDKLRRLRDKVEAQESKLRKLRAMRGQADQVSQLCLLLNNIWEHIRIDSYFTFSFIDLPKIIRLAFHLCKDQCFLLKYKRSFI